MPLNLFNGSHAMRNTLSCLFFVLGIQFASADDKLTAPDFSKYPQTESFKTYLAGHTNATWQLQHTNLLFISAFPNGGRFANEWLVTDSGQERNERNVYNWAVQATHREQLSEGDLKIVRSAIKELPIKSVTPPIERLIIISYRDGTNWVTRSYDSSTLPKPMSDIFSVIGIRFDSKDVR
jgi:hypothetical protein